MTTSSLTPYLIFPDDTSYDFPDVSRALRDPNGLLAIGGDLVPERLIAAYRRGIFPWYNKGEPVLWWSPDPRAVLFPDELVVSRSLRKKINRGVFKVTRDEAFKSVITACGQPRRNQRGTWITDDMLSAYCELHRLKYAHSVECWLGEKLAGGLYGIAIGKVFFGESMFSRETDASKVALFHLVNWLKNWGYELIDCQVTSPHILSLGAREIPRPDFIDLLEKYCVSTTINSRWEIQ